MKVLVSSCIMGKNCKYNGGNNLNPKVVEFLKDKEVIEICPELLANMPTPRPSAEIVNGIVMDINGNIVDEEYRHNEIHKLIPKATDKMLAQQLRELEKDGLINRKVYPVVPPKTEYSLTEFGKTLTPILDELCNWGENYLLQK